jgi:hypothetical protein
MSCIFSNDLLTVSSINPTTKISAGSVCIFTVSSIRNPMSTAAETGITITTLSSDGGSIDSSSTTFQATTAAVIASGSAVADGTSIVSEQTTVDLTFSLPLPMNIGCIIKITFPSDMQITTTNLIEVNGFGLFGAKVSIPLSIDTANNQFTVSNACDTYKTTDFDAIIEFKTVNSPQSVMPSSSFSISITTSDGYSIASTNSGIIYTASAGSISIITATADDTAVGNSTSVLFSFYPTHKIAISSRIVVTLPSEASITARDSAS